MCIWVRGSEISSADGMSRADAQIQFRKIEVQLSEKNLTFNFFSKLASATSSKHPSDVIRVLRVLCALPALTHCKGMCAGRAWRWRVVCRWAGRTSKELKFNFSEIGIGHLHKPPQPKESLVCSKSLIVWSTLHFCLFQYKRFVFHRKGPSRQVCSLSSLFYLASTTYYFR